MCGCIERTNAFLADHNTRITLPMLGPQLPFVLTEKVDDKKRGKPAFLFATYCPLCGEKYSDAKAEAA
jgi:hypothetical protein